MTREQALNYLKSSGFSEEQIQAIVKALSGSEIPTDSDNLSSGTRKNSKKLEKDFGELDCIPREKAIAWAEFYTNAYDAETANESIMEMLRDLPPVTPQDIDYKAQYERLSQKAEIVITQLRADRDRLIRPKGHWKKGDSWSDGCGMGEYYGRYYECSNCGGTVKDDYLECSYSYCPYCGSDNREVEE